MRDCGAGPIEWRVSQPDLALPRHFGYNHFTGIPEMTNAVTFVELHVNQKGRQLMQAIRIQQTVKKNGELVITNLPVTKGQRVEVLLLFTPSSAELQRPRLTARRLLNSGLIGLWKDRTDITDSATYARQLREQAQRRPGISGIGNDNPG